MYLAKSPKRSKRREGRPERKKTVSWRRKVTTVASWNSVKLAIRSCILECFPPARDLESGRREREEGSRDLIGWTGRRGGYLPSGLEGGHGLRRRHCALPLHYHRRRGGRRTGFFFPCCVVCFVVLSLWLHSADARLAGCWLEGKRGMGGDPVRRGGVGGLPVPLCRVSGVSLCLVAALLSFPFAWSLSSSTCHMSNGSDCVHILTPSTM